MTWRQTDAVSTVREVPDQPRTVEGIAVPYGQVSLNTEVGAEAFAPSAFRQSVEHWMGRQDGAKMAFRPEHKARPIGTVTALEDTPAGVSFRASIFDSPAGDEYLSEVRAGLNGISVEFGPGSVPSRKMRDGTTLHREAKLHAIAGSISPAYDTARISLRDMEEPMDTENKTEEQKAPEEKRDAAEAAVKAPEVDQKQRSAAEAATVKEIKTTASIFRPQAVYGPRSGHSYFADMMHSKDGDGDSLERLSRHQKLLTEQVDLQERAGTVDTANIPGAYPNEYLPGLLDSRILKGRPMGGFYSRFPITTANPKIYPRVTTSTSVAVQANEQTSPAASDFVTEAETATPLLYGGHTVVSRQILDGADPSIDSMLMGDLTEAYAQASEQVILDIVEADAGASGVAITAATPFAGAVANVIAYQAARFSPAEAIFVPPALFAVLAVDPDTAGRPLMPWLGAMNADGTLNAGGGSGSILGAQAILSWASTVNVVVTARKADYAIFESSLASFRYDQTNGPAGIDIGIWAYLTAAPRKGSLSVTAA